MRTAYEWRNKAGEEMEKLMQVERELRRKSQLLDATAHEKKEGKEGGDKE